MLEGNQDASGPKELNTTKIQFMSLYELPLSEKQNVKDRLKTTNGTCQMWIHTHHKENEKITLKERVPEILNYRQRRNHLIEKTISSNMPIIAFIQFDGNDYNLQEQIEIHRQYYETNLDTTVATPTVYYVPTFLNTPLPCTFQTSKDQSIASGYPEKKETITNEWNNLANVLNDLGVKKAILSGAYYEKITNGAGISMPGCVNEAQKRLTQQGFQVFVSNVVSPRPNQLIKIIHSELQPLPSLSKPSRSS